MAEPVANKTVPAAPKAVSTPNGSKILRIFRRLGRMGKTSLALVGVAVLAPVVYDSFKLSEEKKEIEKAKGVLVIPFHRLVLVEQKNRSLSLSQITSIGGADSEVNKLIEVGLGKFSSKSLAFQLTFLYIFSDGSKGISKADSRSC